MVLAVQESIINALKANDVEYQGEVSLKDAVISWLSNNTNRDYFNNVIRNEFPAEFGGDDVAKIIEKLQTYTGDKLILLMSKINKVARKRVYMP